MKSMIPSSFILSNGEDLSQSYICLIEDKIFQCIERLASQEKEKPNLREFQKYIKMIPAKHLQVVLDGLVFAGYLDAHKNSRTVRYSQIKTREIAVCEICGKTEEVSGRSSLSVDHNHVTGKIRGLLCHRCNIGIAVMELDFMQKALEYLLRYE